MARSPIRLVVVPEHGDPADPDAVVLAAPNGVSGWSLPTIAVDDPGPWWGPEHAAAAASVIGTGVVPVRRLQATTWLVAAVGRVPTAGRDWVPIRDPARLGAGGAAVAVLAAQRREPPANLADHQREGWHRGLDPERTGSGERTGGAGGTSGVAPEGILRHWELSAVWRHGDRVTKWNAPPFAREAGVLAALAGIDGVPAVLGEGPTPVDATDVTGAGPFSTPWLGERMDDPDGTLAATTLGRIQRTATGRTAALTAAGAATVDDVLAIGAQAMGDRAMGARAMDARATGEPATGTGVVAALEPVLEAVAALGLPASVVHGDAHAGNLVGGGDVAPTIIDWTDALVGSPVVDLCVLTQRAPDPAPVIRAWAAGFDTDPAPLLAQRDAIDALGAAVTVGLYARVRGHLPASADDFWDRWTDDWCRSALDHRGLRARG